MIILTSPKQINSVLGNETAQVGYDRMVLSPLTFDPQSNFLTARVTLTSTANPDMQPIYGQLEANTGTGKIKIEIPGTAQKRMTLSPAQIIAVNKQITDAQNSVETGIVSMGLIAGAQSPGS